MLTRCFLDMYLDNVDVRWMVSLKVIRADISYYVQSNLP